MKNFLLFAGLITILSFSCSNEKGKANEQAPVSESNEKTSGKNSLTMKINDVDWAANKDVWGAFHPKGYNKAIMIAGKKSIANNDEQIFNINIYNAPGPGTFNFKDGNPDFNVTQMLNFTPESFQHGSQTGFNMKVTVTKASTLPDVIEATFEGELTGISGDVLKITEGKFYYHE